MSLASENAAVHPDDDRFTQTWVECGRTGDSRFFRFRPAVRTAPTFDGFEVVCQWQSGCMVPGNYRRANLDREVP